MLVSKNGRLIWDEQYTQSYYGNNASRCIDPNISFDDGKSWMSLGDTAFALREGANAGNGARIVASPSAPGFNQLDITFGFTPFAVAEITEVTYSAISSSEEPTNYSKSIFTGGKTFYFSVMNLTHDTPGFYDNTKSGSTYLYYSGNYYHGPVTGSLGTAKVDESNYYPASKIKEITLPGSSSTKYNINLFVRYPDMTRGLCVYVGDKTNNTTVNNGSGNVTAIKMEAYAITNIVQKLGANVTKDSTTITLANNYPLPYAGTVIVGSEKIKYEKCEIVSGKWVLSELTRINRAEHTASNNIPIYLAMYDGGIYGELPALIHPRGEDATDCVQHIVFDAKTVDDMATNILSGATKRNTTPTVLGNVAYDIIVPSFVNSLRLTGSGAVNTDITSLSSLKNGSVDYYTSLNNKGSLIFSMMLTDFDNTNNLDPYVFAPLNSSSSGLWMKISRFNLKPYFGYRQNGENRTLANFEDYILPSLTKNSFSTYCITWETIAGGANDPRTGYIKFTYKVDGTDIVSFNSDIKGSDFEVGKLCLGGQANSNGTDYTITNTFVGYLDDWRVYKDRVITRNEMIEIIQSNSKNKRTHSGLLTLNGYNINYNNQNLGTNNNSISESSTASAKYEPPIYTTMLVTQSAGRDYGNYYDPWFVNAYTTDGRLKDINNYIIGGYALPYPPENLSYPIKAEAIKVKFDMVGPGDGFSSPKIKNMMLMISESTLD